MAALADRYPRLRRLSPLLLVVGGAALYFSVLSPSIPGDHEVVVQFSEPPALVTRADIVWLGHSAHTDPVGGATYHFPDERVPRELRSVVHAAEGFYTMELTLEGRAGSHTITRTVEIRGDSIKVFLPPSALPAGSVGP